MNFSSLKVKALMASGQTGAAALEGAVCLILDCTRTAAGTPGNAVVVLQLVACTTTIYGLSGCAGNALAVSLRSLGRCSWKADRQMCKSRTYSGLDICLDIN